MTRVFVFGLDAASPFLIERWQDDLPSFRRIMEEGRWGTLHSTIPPFTSPAWACMATGKNPAKTGIFGLRRRRVGSYQFESPTSADRRAQAVWEIAGRAGKQVVVVNVPDTYPPEVVNGIMVSGRPAPVEAGARITHPAGWQADLERITGGYRLGPVADFDESSRADELDTWRDVLARQDKLLDFLLANEPWELFFYVSMAIDGIGHHFWQHLDPHHPQYDPQKSPAFAGVIQQVYQLEDRRLGKVMDQLGAEDILLVVSDHGSTPCYQHIAVNRWLIDHGYLVLKTEEPAGRSGWLGPVSQQLFALYRRSALVRRLAGPLRRTQMRDTVVHAHFAHKTQGRVPLDALPVDWSQSTAYYLGDDCLYLNVAGREPAGCVSPGPEYESVRRDLQAAMQAARAPDGRPLFAAVHTREEIYQGPYLDQAPDLVLVPEDVSWGLGGAVGDVVFDRPVVGGKHHPEGVVMVWGPEVSAGQPFNADIYDIAPTVLHLLGLAVPEDADGQVRREWFKEKAEVHHRPVQQTRYADRDQEQYEWPAEEAAEVEARLRDLGYLD